jgi:hypothetical protein
MNWLFMLLAMDWLRMLNDHWQTIAGLGGAAFFAYQRYVLAVHWRWTKKVLEFLRRSNLPVRVFIHDREHLEWAVKYGHLQVVEEFAGGWLVIENFRLGTGITPSN